MNYINFLLHTFGLLALFIIDVSGIMLFKQLCLQSVLCVYIARLFNQPSFFASILAICLIHLEWFILYDSLSLAALFLLPITALVFYLKRVLVPRPVYPPLILILCLGLQAWLVYNLTNQLVPYNFYTIGAFIANMIVLLSNSLIW